ncbi:MAG: glycosyltransferase family 4 protein [Acidimicrobiia bacterium]|nr:glycosyltransferase family 4 protein [Acidimicrobiia bacterium]
MIAIFAVVVTIGFTLTLLIQKSALKTNRLDIPNERSSHTSPTPRGAGLAVVVAFLLGLLALLVDNSISDDVFLAIALPGLIVALIGLLDDRGHLTSAKWRLVGHFTCAVIAVWLAGGLPELPLANSTINFGLAGDIAAVVYLVWMLNLFNFMDGIDLITGVQTFTTSAGVAVLLLASTENDLWKVFVVLTASILGFLFFNLPPAKIFLGDVGSGFIGFITAVISLVIAKDEPLVAWSMIILHGIFVTDATVTLLRRLLSRERVYIAHRTHAYQHLSKKLNRHLPVSLGVGAINLLFLLPIAWLVTESKIIPIFGIIIAYAPLIIVAALLNAGKKVN